MVDVETLDDAIKIINSSPYGNGASIYTSSGAAARYFTRTVEPGQIGVNVPIRVPVPTFRWSDGPQGLYFYLQNKTITSHLRVDDVDRTRSTVSMPIHQ